MNGLRARLDSVLLSGGLAMLVLAGVCWGAAETPLGDRLGGDVGDSLGGTAAVLALVGLVILIAGALRATRRAVLPRRSTRGDGLLVTGLAFLVVGALCVAAGYSPLARASDGEAGFGWLIGAVLFAGVGVVVLVVDALRAGWRAARHHGHHGGHGRATGAA